MLSLLCVHFATVHAGYGQRAKQQLLLDPLLDNDSARPNKLADTLGVGLTAVLMDLFLLDDGPGLRGKVAHGELDLSSVYADVTTTAGAGAAAGAGATAAATVIATGVATDAAGAAASTADATAGSVYDAPVTAASQQYGSNAAQASTGSSNGSSSSSSTGVDSDSRDCLQLLAVVFVALLWRYTPRAALFRTTTTADLAAAVAAVVACEQCLQFCESYRTHFHPHTMIEVSTLY
jgi:hypothetical protein